jgi:uncharacterized membrane protein HdeD (DUF308 family)
MGLAITVLGLVALVAATATSVATALLFGAILAVSGILEIGAAFRFRKTGRFLSYFLGGILSLVVGGLLLFRPLVGLAAITLLLAGFFLASGLFRGITSLLDRYGGWGWDLFYGVVAVFLGVTIFSSWPVSALWVVGVVVGAEIVTRGIAVMAGSLQLRRVLRAGSGVPA